MEVLDIVKTIVSMVVGMYVGTKMMQKSIKNELKIGINEQINRAKAYIQTEEFAKLLQQAGVVVFSGLAKGAGVSKEEQQGGYVKIFGFKVPQAVFQALMQRFLGKGQEQGAVGENIYQ